eukprot:gene16203-17833_t
MGKEEKKIFEKKLVLAQEKPDEVFDLTNCGIQALQPKIFSLFKVLNKEILLLQHNKICNLKDCKMEDLIRAKVLDVSYNQISILPNHISMLTNLVKLDLSYNKLKQLPDELGELKSLQVLNIRANKVNNLPATIKNLQELRTLDISENKDLFNLPVNMCFLKNLEDFVYDKDRIRYPPKEIAVQGINEIRRWFMLIKGEEYAEELAILNAKCSASFVKNSQSLDQTEESENAAFDDIILRREKEREAKKQQQLELEKRILDAQTENAILLTAAAKDRQHVMASAAFEEMRSQAEMHRVYEENEGNRTKLFQDLRRHEDSLDETVQFVLQFAEKSRHTEKLLDELEADRERMEQLFRITREEAENLRKQEVIHSMTMVMEELEKHQLKFHEYEQSRDRSAHLALRSFVDSNQDVESLLAEREAERTDLLQKVSTEIDMIQNELMKITSLERQRREEQEAEEVTRLAEMRINTAVLLSQLIGEQEKREHELVQRLKEMENYKEDEMKDYWLIQFQRLLDSKPQVLIDEEMLGEQLWVLMDEPEGIGVGKWNLKRLQRVKETSSNESNRQSMCNVVTNFRWIENQLDVYVADILMDSSAKIYLPMFARKKVTRQQMNNMTDQELREIGVKDDKARNQILATIKNHVFLERKAVEKSFTNQQSVSMEDDGQGVAASAPPVEGMVAEYEQECVICLDKRPDMIFLNCGHLCTCAVCSAPLNQCPLCRQEIAQKFRLFGT